MKLNFLFAIVALLLFSCNKNHETISETGEIQAVEEVAVDYEFKEQATATPLENNQQDLKIIKTANLRFATDNLTDNFNIILKATTQYKAYIQNDNSEKDYYSIYRNITIRIPNQHFDSFISEISKGIAFFDRKEISAQDVTEEFVDVEARLKAKKTLESRYLELLKKAHKVSEMLEIERELSTIREEIEAQEGRLKYLQNKVSMSTISIQMYTEIEKGTGTTVSYGSKMCNAVKSGFNGLSNFFLGMLYIWPFILILAIIFFVIRKKWKKRKFKNEKNI